MSRRKEIKAKPAPIAKTPSVWQRWWTSKGPFFRFGASFIGLTALFSAISLTPFFEDFLLAGVRFDASFVSKALNCLGQQTHNAGDTIISTRFAMTVLSECSASEFVIFLWAGLLAFPTTSRRKIVGIVLGTLGVFFVNLMRLVTLFLVGVYRPHFFTTVHEELWPGLFSIAMIAFAVSWASWTTCKLETNAAA